MAKNDEDAVHEASEESFPASDPPSWTPVTAVGPPAQTPSLRPRPEESSRRGRPDKLTRQIRADHEALVLAMQRLEAALATLGSGTDWNQRLGDDLGQVEEALLAHVAAADSPQGLYAQVDVKRPTLVHRVEKLRQEHQELIQHAKDLRSEVERATDTSDLGRRVSNFITALRRHQAGEEDLLYESFSTDLGAAD